PDGMIIDPQTGQISWTPAVAQIGSNSVSILADDGQGGTSTQDYNVIVAPDPANHAPLIISDPVTTLEAGAAYEYQVRGLDPDGDPITYRLSSPANGLTIDSSTGLISGIPQAQATSFFFDFESGAPAEFNGATSTESVQGYAGLGKGSNVFSGQFLRNQSG